MEIISSVGTNGIFCGLFIYMLIRQEKRNDEQQIVNAEREQRLTTIIDEQANKFGEITMALQSLTSKISEIQGRS